MASASPDSALKVFWPTSGLTRGQGDLVGWRIGDDVCVVAVVDSWERQEPNNDDKAWPGLHDLEVLGTAESRSNKVSDVQERLTLYLDGDKKPISSLQSVSLILYDVPNISSLRYFNPGSSAAATHGFINVSQSGDITKDVNWQQVVTKINVSYKAQQHLISQPGPSKEPVLLRTTQLDRPGISDARTTASLLSYSFLGLSPLGSLSASLHQICVRLDQLVRVPDRYLRARQVGDVKERAETYNLFWGTIWLVLNDLILGYLARDAILHYGPNVLLHLQSTYQRHLVDTPIQTLQWLNSWPVGLKLNTPLSQFFCVFFQGVIRHWSEITMPYLTGLAPSLPQILALSSFTGLSTSLALLSDLMSLLALHLTLSWKVMQWVCGWQASSLYGLWNLFRGKRWNVLRLRTDLYEYDIDQLFLGTLLFTVSAFLFPTVLSYTALFFLMRVACLAVDSVLRGGQKLLLRGPLFEMMLRLKDPARLPGGIKLEKAAPKGGARAEGQDRAGVAIEEVSVLTSTPKSFWDIAGQAIGW
ncbi:hypothetical protein B9479_007926 [Cryptococcus floricola]|uniref:Uncharacterized protein n=1 Tax=Cryptococcus floricola TaxID=2591691 RepID=A0A5D3APA3_9TREE|nr:hypothetical protein B9479_007926 [Cryptococcus floricola]